MSWRTVIITTRCKLDLKMGYMVIRGEDTKRIFLDEIAVLLIENPAVSFTGCLLEAFEVGWNRTARRLWGTLGRGGKNIGLYGACPRIRPKQALHNGQYAFFFRWRAHNRVYEDRCIPRISDINAGIQCIPQADLWKKDHDRCGSMRILVAKLWIICYNELMLLIPLWKALKPRGFVTRLFGCWSEFEVWE